VVARNKDVQSSKIILLKLSEAIPKADEDRPSRAAHLVERYEMPVYVARMTVLIMSGLVVALILWSALSRIDVIAEAPGKLIPVGDVKQVQPAFDSVIEKVLVVEGEPVSQGQPLILLDRKPYDAEVKKREQALEISKSELQEHHRAKEMLGSAIRKPGVLPEQKVDVDGVSQTVEALYSAHSALVQANKDQSRGESAALSSDSDTALLLQQLDHMSLERTERGSSLEDRTRELHSKRSELLTQLEAKRKELTSSKEVLEKMRSILGKSERQAKAYKAVYQQGALSMIDYLQSEKRVEEEESELIKANSNIANIASQVEVLKSQIAQLDSQTKCEIAERQAQIKSLSSQIETVRMKLRETDRHFSLTRTSFDAAMSKAKAAFSKETSEIAKGERRVSELQSELLQAEHSFDQSTMKSPVDGTVTVIKTLGSGQVVGKGQPLLTIVPSSCPLVVEAKLPNKDIGFVRKGQKVRLKLAAFPYQDYGILEGTVSEIEKHAQEDQKLGSYYKVIITPKQDWVVAGKKKIHFTSGAALTAEIVVRRKSVLNVLLEPIRKAADIHWTG
jgi:HlyD family secretion protein